MKKLATFLLMFLMVCGGMLHADETYTYYDPYTPQANAPVYGTEAGTAPWLRIGVATAAVVTFIAVIATNTDSASSHTHNQ